MARILGRFLLILLLAFPSTLMLAGSGGHSSMLVQAEDPEDVAEDMLDGEDGEGVVSDDDDEGDVLGSEATATEDGQQEDEDEEVTLKPSQDGDTVIQFIKPSNQEFPAGALVKFMVGFQNKGDKDFVIETMDASFRYPQDYSYYIQNFTTVRFDRTVEPGRHATFDYRFTTSDTFNARPFGLVVNLNYKDMEGNLFQDAVFNDTINIVESDDGLDGETFFLYIFLAAVLVLLLVGAQQLVVSFGKKRGGFKSKSSHPVEMGTQNKNDVDYDWIPRETLQNHSPGRSPKQSPRQRRSKRNAGTDE